MELKPTCIIVDLDGTLCNVDHRRHHVECEKEKQDWGAFFDGIEHDTPHEWCRQLLYCFKTRHQIVFVSGRWEKLRHVTEAWIFRNLGWRCHFDYLLFMRPNDEGGPDYLVKKAIYTKVIEPRFETLFVVDDRASVVHMWRHDLKLPVLDCAGGTF